jgi:hypothetical protein
MGDTYTMDDGTVVGDIRAQLGELTGDEAALVRTLTPADMDEAAKVEHLSDLVDLLATIRDDEAVAEYVYAIAPGWDGTIETLLLGGRVTTAFNRYELESCGATPVLTGRAAPPRRTRAHRVPAPVG